MPNPTQGSGTSSTTDYEQLSYDANSNVTNRRLRDAQNIAFTYDNLNRPTLKNLPGSEPDVTYGYDNLGRLTSATQTGNSLSFSYDALSRNLTQVGPQGTVASQWDVAGRRTKLTYPGSGLYVDYDYLVTGEMTKIRENGATSGVGVLATYAYDNLGRRSSMTFGNGVVQSYGFDAVSRLASLTNELSGTTNDLSVTFAYNPASQIASTVRTGDNYAWTAHFNTNVTGTANGLNQLTSVGPKSLTHDARGNITAFGTKSFTYSSENLLLTGPGSTTLGYDPALRLYQSVSGATTLRLAYDGLDRIAEYDGINALQRRYVHGPGVDEPLVQYEGSGTGDRRFLSSDERGSIISLTDSSGTLLGINRYDEYGNPQATNLGTFGYTSQAWLNGIGVWYYKARDYDPELGRFLQTDPIGTEGGINLYAYVGNDPINFADPTGHLGDKPCLAIDGCYTIGGYWERRDVPDPFRDADADSVVTGGWKWIPDRTFSFGGIRDFVFDIGFIRESGFEGEGANQEQCAGPPRAPGTGMSRGALKALARKNADSARGKGAIWFYNQVRNRGPWDYKQRSRGFADFGNYNYGYTGAALGVSLELLLRQAGDAQVRAGTSRPEWGGPGHLHGMVGGSPPYGDDPADQEQIKRGYGDYRKGCK